MSGSSDFSVNGYSYGRDSLEEGVHAVVKNMPPFVNGLYPSNVMVKNNLDGSMSVNDGCTGTEEELKGMGNGLPLCEETDNSHSHKSEMDLQFWLPPEAEDQEHDVEGSVANYDDDDEDDECDDGTKWGKPSSLSSFGEQGSGSYRYKEEKQKAMDDVMNCKFKALVGHLLKSMGFPSSGKDGNNWVDIVTSLSWEAALFVKPNTNDGKAMDPDGYVKVKCVATGCRSESQVIKGMVFKKRAAHKHMPRKYKNPRLLLIQGALDLSLSGLSAFESMKQEKDTLKSIIERIEMCRPNVVLVEKSVSRVIQESILAKGMTLVYDMKLHRLERVAHCTGSSILSSDTLCEKKLRLCDSFHLEKFVEEHDAFGESGKRPSKSLMFLEGCPTRLGCTILLKGTNSEELKKIKFVVQYAVLVAYHLILETAFLLDQRAMFSTLHHDGVVDISLTDQSPSVGCCDANVCCNEESPAETDSTRIIDIHIPNEFHEEESHNMGLEGDTLLPYEPYKPVDFSGFLSLSASQKGPFRNSFPLLYSSNQSVSTYFDEVPNSQIQSTYEVSTSPEVNDHSDIKINGNSDEEKALDNDGTTVYREVPRDTQNPGGTYEDKLQFKDDISALFDAYSILVVMSSRNSLEGTICKQSHFSNIKFYRNFDVPLGIFLRDSLLNQRLLCNSCGGSPESHIYYYAHHNKQLTIQVRRLPMENRLNGETEGKLWMWSRCGSCKPQNGTAKSTKRVLISAATRNLSFGKFLVLNLSNHSSFRKSPSCGHHFHRDFLYFFGLGSMIAMVKYSPVTTYSVYLPPEKLIFSDLIRGERLRKDIENISKMYEKGIEIFLEIENSLKKIGSCLLSSKLNIQGTWKEFSDIEDMLKQERLQFEVDLQNTLKNWNSGDSVYKLVSLNQVQWEILLVSVVWDRRLYSIILSESATTDTTTSYKLRKEQSYPKEDDTAGEKVDREIFSEEVFDNGADLDKNLETSVEANDCPGIEVPTERQNFESATIYSHVGGENATENNSSLSAQSRKIVPFPKDLGEDVLDFSLSLKNRSSVLLTSNLLDSEGWVWTPFPEIRHEYMKDLQKGYSLKFEPINSHARGSKVHDMITNEGSRLHIPLGIDNYIVSDYEGELSSIIACALALLRDPSNLIEDLNEDANRGRGMDAKAYERSRSVTLLSSSTSSYWSSFGSFSSDGMYSSTSISSDDSSLSSINGLYVSDSLVSFGDLHPEVSMGLRKFPGKGKYSVLSLYASQFQELRRRCCPSELDYIASLSRCRNWDAKGGKSKSFFAKTLDDCFIIKEIKRTEYESFMKFALDYFKYMKDCFEFGNQTCLAKILGIYQVTVRQKSGKETKHDVMVMENLTFGRKVNRQYDLKGALHSRLNSAPNGSGDVLLDQNFVNDMNESPFYVSRKAKRNLQRAVWNDTNFLNSINVMDYSLLVGVDTQKRELVCGIIDYLRQYTWDKQLENWVKSSLVVPKHQLPTVISPKEYKKRFRKFFTTHFLNIPDHWCSQVSTSPSDDGDSSHGKSRGQGSEDSSDV